MEGESREKGEFVNDQFFPLKKDFKTPISVSIVVLFAVICSKPSFLSFFFFFLFQILTIFYLCFVLSQPHSTSGQDWLKKMKKIDV